ncbi:MAG TPA: hypothetical protein VFT59_02305 [Candidatus Saccharimonadales bacterium]|nr:hypothetical protein [Candidatus Saccharimonadales bacterium]
MLEIEPVTATLRREDYEWLDRLAELKTGQTFGALALSDPRRAYEVILDTLRTAPVREISYNGKRKPGSKQERARLSRYIIDNEMPDPNLQPVRVEVHVYLTLAEISRELFQGYFSRLREFLSGKWEAVPKLKSEYLFLLREISTGRPQRPSKLVIGFTVHPPRS